MIMNRNTPAMPTSSARDTGRDVLGADVRADDTFLHDIDRCSQRAGAQQEREIARFAGPQTP